MPTTMDPGDFDIHEFEQDKPKVYSVTKKEKIDSRVLKGIEKKPKTGRRKKRKVFIAFVANILLPGLGNLIIGKTAFGAMLFLANLFFLAAAFSPTSVLGFLGNISTLGAPPVLSYATIVTAGAQTMIEVRPGMVWTFFVALAVAALAWLHFLYLLIKKK